MRSVAGEKQPPSDEAVNVVFSHIRPQPGIGYDERRYVSLWGPLRRTDSGLELTPDRVQHWDEQEMTFFEYSERGVPQAHRYLEQVTVSLRPSTVKRIEHDLRQFGCWLASSHPEVGTCADLHRAHPDRFLGTIMLPLQAALARVGRPGVVPDLAAAKAGSCRSQS